ncbi:MAG: serine/threonine-protein kinase PpkA [Oceanicoccus sp.]|jgi:serine/threonine-protein kinase PpkA
MAIPGYRILSKIRQGGMSTVYLAVQESVDRQVAIKVMSPSLNNDPGFANRFKREATIVGQLSHPNIVSIYDVGKYKKYNYIAMDYLPGTPLQDRLKESIDRDSALDIVRDIALALDYAHSRGYIHRDIKPDNILFRENGGAVLCDFGIAKAIKTDINMTQLGSVLGTPHYMSPEQAQGKDTDGRSDIYSLGVVLFEMLCGQVPFSGDDPVAVAVKHISSPVPKLPVEHKLIQPIIETMMAKKPAQRYQTGNEVIAALDKLEHDLTENANPHTQSSASTSLQILQVSAALFSTLLTTVTLSLKRLMLSKVIFTSSPKALSSRQIEELDRFILDDDATELADELSDALLIQDTVEQLAITLNRGLLYWPVFIIGSILVLFIYIDKEHPERLRQVYSIFSMPVANPEESRIDLSVSTLPKAVVELSPIASSSDIESAEIVEASISSADIKRYELRINSQPADARISILNIKPRFRQGISLEPGDYRIKVAAEDYFSHTFWLRINDQPVQRSIILEANEKTIVAGTIIQHSFTIDDKDSDNPINGPTMVVVASSEPTSIAVSQYEISFHQYDIFAQQTERRLPKDFGWGRDNRPVVDVSYEDALAYAQWLTGQSDNAYRLPQQQEWQQAARADSTTAYWWGDNSASKQANCKKGCDSKFAKLFGSRTAPVGHYPANGWQIFDSAGNVAEWLAGCQQWQSEQQQECKRAQIAGGSHQDSANKISADNIKTTAADTRSKTIGFRLVLELD